MSFRQRDAVIYVSKTRQSDAATPVTAGASFLRVASQNLVVQIPQLEKRTDQGRAGGEFATKSCNTYWLPPAIAIQDDANFDAFARLSLRGVGGSITGPTTIVTSLAFKYVAPMLPGSSGLELPYFTVLAAIPGSGANFLHAGCVVDEMTMSQEGANPIQLAFQIIGTGKHRSPHAVTSLPSLSSFVCLKSTAILEYTDSGGLVDLTDGCIVRSWTITLDNNFAPQDARCIGDPTQDVNDYTSSGGLSDAAYLSKLEHGDRVVSASITLELDATLEQQVQMAENEELTDVTFGAVGVDLDPSGTPDTTFETLKWIIPTATFSSVVQVDSNGKAAMTLTFFPKTTSTSVLSVEVVNGTSTGVQ